MTRAAVGASNFVDDPARCNCNQVRRAARRLSRYYDLALAPSGLKATQYGLLSYLVTSGPMTMARLAKLMSMDRATTGHNLRPLVRDGFVEISVGETDRAGTDRYRHKAGSQNAYQSPGRMAACADRL
ncbi:putative transcriptional regulator [Bradyrhizobium sp. GM7.3]